MKAIFTDMEGVFIDMFGKCPSDRVVSILYDRYLRSSIQDVVEWAIYDIEKIQEEIYGI